MKKKYRIRCQGCDDSTYVEMDFTDGEFNLIKSLCEKVTQTSETGCQPVMAIEEVVEKAQK